MSKKVSDMYPSTIRCPFPDKYPAYWSMSPLSKYLCFIDETKLRSHEKILYVLVHQLQPLFPESREIAP